MIKISDYTLLEKINETAQYNKYLAKSRNDNSRYYITLIKKQNLTPSYTKRLYQEFETLKNTAFSGIIKPESIMNHEYGIAVITPKMQHITLDEYMSSKKIRIETCLNIILQLSDILGILHSYNILHKNICPENIIINQADDIPFITNLCVMPIYHSVYTKLHDTTTTEKIIPYISPEQTGMTNRQMDHRSELYSLGAVSYRMLTGIVPFQSENPIEIINSHVLKKAIPPCEINHDIPPVLSDIILKLLKKNPENRYQSGFGLYSDIKKCITSLYEKGDIGGFIPGENDIPQKLIISKKLYGRTKNIEVFKNVFENVRQGNSEIINVTGPSGIGKTTLILNILYPVIKNRGYFITGKCDQLHRDTPYYPLLLAFQGLVKQILAESNDGIEIWEETILDVVGNNGKILIDVIPDIELIIGPQQECPQLESEESRNRFNMIFTNFIRIFTTSNYPLTLFIDDLQWVDSATMLLIKNLIADPEKKSLFLISAYRDNEISKYHNLAAINKDLELAGVPINEIHLSPLNLDDISELITDTLKCPLEKSLSMAGPALEFTRGNPLSVNQFLNMLYEEKILTFYSNSGWNWDVQKIKNFHKTENFISLMSNKIKMLPDNERKILEYASCIGNTFDISILTKILERHETEVITDINKITDAGFISASENMYKFTHDRIYETAYSMISDNDKVKIHNKIGTTLLSEFHGKDLQGKIFKIVNQLNIGSKLFDNKNENERIKLAQLNFQAGMKAMFSVAYESAVKYFSFGLKLLPADSWEKFYDLTIRLSSKNFECQYLLNNLEEAYLMFQNINRHSRTNLEKAQLHNINATLLMNSGKPGMAILMGIEGLKLLDVKISGNPGRLKLLKEKAKLKRKLFKKSVRSIITLPEMTDDTKINAMSLLLNIWMPAYAINHNLMHLITMKMVNTSIEYGNCNISSFGYMTYGIDLGAGEGKYKAGHELGTIALRLNEKLKNHDIKCQLNLMFGAFLAHWSDHVETGVNFLTKAYQFGIESGNVNYSRLSCIFHAGTMFIKGDNLEKTYQTSINYLDYTESVKNIHVSDSLTVVARIIMQLQGKIKNTLSLTDENFNENGFFMTLKGREVIQPLHWYCLFKSRNLYIFEHYEEANEIASIDDTVIDWHISSITLPEHYFIHSLILAAIYRSAGKRERKKILKKINTHQTVLKLMADNCPQNFLHKYLLVEAEKCRLMSEDFRAMGLYNRSIGSAAENGYVQNEAIANELAGKFYIEKGFIDIAKQHICAAKKAYLKWGALQKVRILDEKYPQYMSDTFDNIPESNKLIAKRKISDPIKINLIQRLQVLSNKKNTPDLETSITELACNITSADKAFLILNKNDSLVICSCIDHELGDEIRITEEHIPGTDKVPETVINCTINSCDYIISDEPVSDERFSNDPYINSSLPKSILCFPLMNKGNCEGLLYLEKNISKSDFTLEQLEMLKITANHSTVLLGNMSHSQIKKIQKYDHSLLKGLDTKLIHEKLKNLMERRKIFMTEDLTLSMMSEELSITPQQLSEFLNTKLSVNFNAYINQFRIKEAKKILINEPEKPVISIAYDTGFNSISVFYSAFMKFNGMSPAKYRKQQLCPNSDMDK